ncbi:hypothetical protein N836_15560 [Leptolyngbya sp. Heron Island J]|uniref:hypothetical protein n=1 Tax=Leptolyngbya sp. Heron Island J TaxID=1385935 RepID=UPI0003B9C01D|nr:hypothetical protein [Leptolyngbya sp. Heron Island J]ESA34834.1 hypothetical protein N836_15560 [Leptolyngbya sp. Heron Island J]
MTGLHNNALDRSTSLTTEFVLMTIELQADGIALRNHIETQLRFYGEPLRWAITSVDGTMAQVEAVVTVGDLTQL